MSASSPATGRAETRPSLPRLNNVGDSVTAITQRLAFLSVLAMLIIATLMMIDVALRAVKAGSVPGLNETTSLLLGIAVSACLPAGLAGKVNLRIDLLDWTRWPRFEAIMNMLSDALLWLFIGLLTWRLGVEAQDTGAQGITTVLMLWPIAPFLWVITALLALSVLVQSLVTFETMRRSTPLLGRFAIPAIFGILALAGAMIWGVSGQLPMLTSIQGASTATIAAIAFGAIWVGIVLRLPVAVLMAFAGFAGVTFLLGLDPALSVFGSESKKFMTSEALVVLPLFMLMGSLASVAGLASDIYKLANGLLGHLRGGLAYGTVIGCAGFGALTGSSLACAVTVGRAAMPEMRARNYDPGFSAGVIAAGGTLGQIIPPSTVIILYALLTEESIGRLFIGALGVAVLAIALYLATIFVVVRLKPGIAPEGKRTNTKELFVLARQAWGVIALFGMVTGGIYSGLVTETEAASLGVIGAFLFALLRGKLSNGALWNVTVEATASIALIYALILGTAAFTFFIGASGLPEVFVDFLNGLSLAPMSVVLIFVASYFILGSIMDSFAMMMITVPLFAPMIVGLGFDPIWWGLLTVVLVETGMITPPFGLNLFILKSIDPKLRLAAIYRGVLPFCIADALRIACLIAMPGIVTWLPKTMG